MTDSQSPAGDSGHDQTDASDDKSGDHSNGNTVDLEWFAEQVQNCQDILESVEDEAPAEALLELETVEEDLERLEDGIEHAGESLSEGFEADVQTTQDDINDLQETLATGGVDPDLFREVEDMEDAVEAIEDRAVDARERYGVKVDNDPVEFFDEASPTAEDILRRFGKDTDDALVAEGTEDTYSGDDEVDLSAPGVERFDSEPRTPGNS